jgi:hypothetical protein
MTWIEIRKRFEKFQKLLARWADAETPAVAETAATMVRKLMAARAIDPWSVPDESVYEGGPNLGHNALFQKLRQEHRRAHPLASDQLAWEIDAEQSIDLAVAYKAGLYRLKPYRSKGSRGDPDYPRYAVYFDEWGYPARHALRNGGDLSSTDAMELAQRHHLRQVKAAKVGANKSPKVGVNTDFDPDNAFVEVGANKSAEVSAGVGKPPKVGANKPDLRKGDRHRPRKGDRHSPGYMRDYMRQRRAQLRKDRET